MSLPLIVRPMRASETNLVLSAWKNQLFELRTRSRWGKGLEPDCFWALTNHVIDRITLPSSIILMGCHEDEIDTPLCWAAVRKLRGLSTYETLYTDARDKVLRDRALAATLERELLSEITKTRPMPGVRRAFNPFLELKR